MKTLKELGFREDILSIIKKDGTCKEITDFIETLFIFTLKQALAEIMPEEGKILPGDWKDGYSFYDRSLKFNIKTFFGEQNEKT